MFHNVILTVALTEDNAISPLDTAGVLMRSERKCPAAAPVENQHAMKVKQTSLCSNILTIEKKGTQEL